MDLTDTIIMLRSQSGYSSPRGPGDRLCSKPDLGLNKTIIKWLGPLGGQLWARYLEGGSISTKIGSGRDRDRDGHPDFLTNWDWAGQPDFLKF